jgi:hypothetical protein
VKICTYYVSYRFVYYITSIPSGRIDLQAFNCRLVSVFLLTYNLVCRDESVMLLCKKFMLTVMRLAVYMLPAVYDRDGGQVQYKLFELKVSCLQ